LRCDPGKWENFPRQSIVDRSGPFQHLLTGRTRSPWGIRSEMWWGVSVCDCDHSSARRARAKPRSRHPSAGQICGVRHG
jgi:hypothetical protein